MIFVKKDMKRSQLPDKADRTAYKGPATHWEPIPHRTLANTIVETAKEVGLKVKSEAWELCRKGNAMVGALVFDPVKGLAMPGGTNLSLGMRHANDGWWALTFAVGAQVTVCSNGLLSGDFVVKRKHVFGIPLKGTIVEGFEMFFDEAKKLSGFVDNLRSTPLTVAEGDSLILDAARENVMPWQMVRPVVQEWREPQHEEFEERTAFALYNAVTEIVKKRPARRQMETLMGLRKITFADAVNAAA